jgi:hypothetical protein
MKLFASESAPAFLRAALPRMDWDSLRGQIECFAAAIQTHEEVAEFSVAVAFLRICFEVIPASKEAFQGICTVDEELLERWPAHFASFKADFVRKD